MKNFIVIFFVFSCLNFSWIQGQVVSGTVVDFSNRSPVADALVRIQDKDNDLIDTTRTNAGGNWSISLMASSVAEGPVSPEKLAVYPNYPNPFNPSTTIPFTVFESGEVQILVHNILGQRVDEKKRFVGPGNYRIRWESRGASGVYFITVTFGPESVTQKMLQMENGLGPGLGDIALAGSDFPRILPKTEAISIDILITKQGYMPDTTSALVSGGEHFDAMIETVHSHATMIDLHNDIIYKIAEYGNYHLGNLNTNNHTDIPRLIQGGVDIQFFALWVSNSTYPNNSYQRVLDYVAILNAELQANPNTIQLARTASEALAINAAGKIAGVMAVEGGHTIENSIEKLVYLHQLGMRYMTITWNNSLDWAVSAEDSRSRTVGLSDLGKKIIRAMDSLGVIIDVSHTGIKTIEDILTTSKNPIIASHSGVRKLRDHYRNLYDDQIKAIAGSGGVIGIVFYPNFLAASGTRVDIETVIKHIDYIVSLVGIDYVAIGSDFDGIERTPVGLENTSKFPNLTLALLKHGYTISDVEKVLGGNFLRVFRQVCEHQQAIAARL